MAIGIPGINLPTQSMAGPVATGQSYAQQIAGGMPMEQVIAPGVSYSPEQAGGYTQADLDLQNRFRGEGPVLVMPKAPTKGISFAPNEGFVQMPSAPQGVAQPTRFMPFLQDLDFSGLPRYEDIKDISGPQDIRPSLFDFDIDEILKNIDTERFEDLDLSGIDIPSIAPVFPTAPVRQEPTTPIVQEPITPVMPQVPVMSEPVIPQVPVMPRAPVIPEPVIPQPPVRQEVSFVPEIPSIPMNFTGLPQMPAMPTAPIESMVQPVTAPKVPVQTLPQSIFENIPKPQPLPMPQVPVMLEPIVPAPRPAPVPQAPIQVPSLPSLPMNFTGLPQIPVMPEPIAPLPVIPQIPVMPQITYTPPVPSFVQPRIEDIVSPIRAGSLRNFQQPGLFSL